MKVIVGMECSGITRNAFNALGHDATSCDLKPTRRPGKHIQGDIFGVLRAQRFDLGIFHPPCTYLTVTANKWLKDQPERKSGALVGAARREARRLAIQFVKDLWALATEQCDAVVFENPVGCLSTEWMKPTQIIQPWQFGHVEPKKTCLWLHNLPLLRPTKIVEPEYHTTESGKKVPTWFFFADRSKGQEHRAEIRSNTFTGVAEAFASQWSAPVTKPQLTLF